MRRHARGVSPTCRPSTWTVAKGTALTLTQPNLSTPWAGDDLAGPIIRGSDRARARCCARFVARDPDHHGSGAAARWCGGRRHWSDGIHRLAVRLALARCRLPYGRDDEWQDRQGRRAENRHSEGGAVSARRLDSLLQNRGRPPPIAYGQRPCERVGEGPGIGVAVIG